MGAAEAEAPAPALLLIGGCTALRAFLQLHCGPGKKSIGRSQHRPNINQGDVVLQKFVSVQQSQRPHQ